MGGTEIKREPGTASGQAMNVASLENCRELYELSGWDDTEKVWSNRIVGGRAGKLVTTGDGKTFPPTTRKRTAKKWALAGRNKKQSEVIPAYDAHSLLTKLPAEFEGNKLWLSKTLDGQYHAWYWDGLEHPSLFGTTGDTAADALCKLAIRTIRSGVR